jgi:hypothetical protein
LHPRTEKTKLPANIPDVFDLSGIHLKQVTVNSFRAGDAWGDHGELVELIFAPLACNLSGRYD